MTESRPGEPAVFPSMAARLLVIMGSLGVVIVARAFMVSGNLNGALIVGDIGLVVSCFGIARSGIRCDAKDVAVQGLTLTHLFTWAEIVKLENRKFHGQGIEVSDASATQVDVETSGAGV